MILISDIARFKVLTTAQNFMDFTYLLAMMLAVLSREKEK